MAQNNLTDLEIEILSLLYAGEIQAMYRNPGEGSTVNWIPFEVLKEEPLIVTERVKALVNKGYLKTHNVEGKELFIVSFRKLDEIRFLWYTYTFKKLDSKLGPILEGFAKSRPVKVLIKPRWD